MKKNKIIVALILLFITSIHLPIESNSFWHRLEFSRMEEVEMDFDLNFIKDTDSLQIILKIYNGLDQSIYINVSDWEYRMEQYKFLETYGYYYKEILFFNTFEIFPDIDENDIIPRNFQLDARNYPCQRIDVPYILAIEKNDSVTVEINFRYNKNLLEYDFDYKARIQMPYTTHQLFDRYAQFLLNDIECNDTTQYSHRADYSFTSDYVTYYEKHLEIYPESDNVIIDYLYSDPSKYQSHQAVTGGIATFIYIMDKIKGFRYHEERKDGN